MRAGALKLACAWLVGAGLLAAQAKAVTWFPLGPYGGDARSFAKDPHDPNHLFLGTATGWVYESHDGGRDWKRVAQVAHRSDLVIDHILVDSKNPKRLIVGAFNFSRPDGGLFISEDDGKTWYEQSEMSGQSVRSLTRSASQPGELVAGTLRGVFRSMDDGVHWKQISPDGSTELHEVESVAIDPDDPQVIYAGTWHLPWKTTDGGAHWVNIKKGIIDDSDVFSIIVDPKQPNIVYASACSGIYKSEDAGAEFHGGVSVNRGQGIPSSARRTRKLVQDPEHLNTVFAGTTEGLYRTIDAGAHWERLTASDIVVNDVYIDPKNTDRVLLATDRGGVLASSDGGESFQAANNGFSTRQVTSYTADAADGGVLYVGTVNDKQTGGVFQSTDGGVQWKQQSTGLDGRDVFSLATSPSGVLLAGTGHGIFRLEGDVWSDSSSLAGTVAPIRLAEPQHGARFVGSRRERRHVHKAPEAKPAGPRRLDATIFALASGGDAVYAGTSDGLMRSDASGRNWTPVTALQVPDARFLSVDKSTVMVAGLKRIDVSRNGGESWHSVALPPKLTQVSSVAVDGGGGLWVGGREGVFYRPEQGSEWQTLKNLYLSQVDGLYYDKASQRVMVASSDSTMAFAVHVPDLKVNYWDTGWHLRFVRPVGDHLIGATLYDGVVVQPRMVDSKFTDTAMAMDEKPAKKLTAER